MREVDSGRRTLGAKREVSKPIREWILLLAAVLGSIAGFASFIEKRSTDQAALQEADRSARTAAEQRAQELAESAKEAMGTNVTISARIDPEQLRKAERLAEAAHQSDKTSPDPLTTKALIALKHGAPPIARTQLDHALRLDPRNPRALILKGVLDQVNGDLESAQSSFEHAREEAERRNQPWQYNVATLNLANIFIEQNKYSLAEPLLDLAEKSPATEALAHSSRGVSLFRNGEVSRAAEEFGKSATIEPDYTRARENQDCIALILEAEQGLSRKRPTSSAPKIAPKNPCISGLMHPDPDPGTKSPSQYWSFETIY